MIKVRLYIVTILLIVSSSMLAQPDIRINEFLANNLTVNMDPDFYAFSDWIEIRNYDDHAIDLRSYSLVYESIELKRWTFSSSTVIEAGGYLLIWADERNTINEGIHTNFTLQREGGKISLLNTSRDTVNTITYGQQEVDVSLGINPNEESEWLYYAVPSPGGQNTGAAFASTDRLERPAFSISGGVYEQSKQVKLASSSNMAQIYYTVDGSKPTFGSAIYSEPIPVEKTTVIRAMAFDNSALPSRITTHSYLINEGITLPVLSISMEHDHFWDDEIGFYVEGTNGLTGWEAGYGPSPKSNFNADWRRPMNIEFFDEKHEFGFSQEGQVKVYGGWSRGGVIKSFAVYPEQSINYQLFKEKSFVNYESFIIRNSGNDWPSTKIRDAALQSLAINHLDLDLQANRPAVLFINGEFWGVLNIREKINEDYVYTNHGVDQDSIDFLEAYRIAKAGDKQHYLQMMEYLSTHSLAIQANYDYFKTLVDVEECLNYFITGIYSGHGDWIYNGNNNLRLWRPRQEDGRWRWLLYDTDGAFYSSSGRGIADAMNTSEILRNILENEGAKDYFISTFTAMLNNAFAPDRAVHMIDSLRALIEPDVTRHINKWKNTNEDGSTADWKTPGSENYIQIDDGYMGPSLASYDQWNSKFGTARSVAAQRPEWLFTELRTLFNLGSPRAIRCRLSAPNSGIILVNDIEVLEYNGTDRYLDGQTLEFEALPGFGYKFKHWEVGSYTSINTTIIETNASWKYLDDGTDQGSNWRMPAFDDNSWSSGYGELGYGDGGEATTLEYGGDASNKHICTYFRKQFTITDPNLFDEISLEVMRDDGIVIYLNGSEVARDNMPSGTIDAQTLALAAVSNADESNYYHYAISPEHLVTGVNTIAVEIHQISLGSSDISFDLGLSGVQTSPVNNQVITTRYFSKTISGNTLVKAVFDTTSFEQTLFINEIMANNVNCSWPSENGNSKDWIEIYNKSSRSVNLAGMHISDDISNPGLYKIPGTDHQKTEVPAGKFRVLYADGMPELGPDHLIFKLDKESEEIALSGMYARKIVIIDSLSFSQQIMDVSFGRYPDGASNSIFMGNPSPVGSNRADNPEVISGLFINEFMPDNVGLIADNYGEFDDWIEVYNSNDYPVSMAGLFLSDDHSNPTKWRIPKQYIEKTTIPARGHIIFWADEDIEQGVKHLNFQLAALEEQIGLYQLMDQEILIIDTLSYSIERRNVSYGRFPDSDQNMYVFEDATPGTANHFGTFVAGSDLQSEMSIYPNPSDGTIFIKRMLPASEESFDIQVYSLQGELLQMLNSSVTLTTNDLFELDLSAQPPGLYFIRIINTKGAFTQKIVIQ